MVTVQRAVLADNAHPCRTAQAGQSAADADGSYGIAFHIVLRQASSRTRPPSYLSMLPPMERTDHQPESTGAVLALSG